MVAANKYTNQLQRAAVIRPEDLFILFKEDTGITYNVRADQVMISTQTQNFEWDQFRLYVEGEIVTYKGKIWQATGLAGNQGQAPTEGVWWEERSKSAAGFVLHQNGFFFEDDVYVLKELDGKLQLFRLDPNLPRPFESSDFFLEFARGDWQLASESGYLVVERTQHGWVEDAWVTIKDNDWALTDATDTGLGKIMMVVDDDHLILQLKTKVLEGFEGLTAFTTYYHTTGGALTATANGNPAIIAISPSKAIVFPGSGVGAAPEVPTLAQVLAAGADGGGATITNVFFDASALATGTISIDRLPASAFQSVHTYTGAQTLPQNAGLTIAQVQNGDIVYMQTAGTHYVVIDDTQLNAAGGYAPYTISTAWSSISNKPVFGNGITEVAGTPGTVRLGGPLLVNTDIQGAGFIFNLGTSGSKLASGSIHSQGAFALTTYAGLNSRSSLAGNISDTSKDGLWEATSIDVATEGVGTLTRMRLGRPNSGETVRITNSTGNADTSGVKDLLTLERTLEAGTAGANGIGARIKFDIKNAVAAGGDAPAGSLTYSLTNVTQNLEAGKYTFSLPKLGVATDMLEIDTLGARYLTDLSSGFGNYSLIDKNYLLAVPKTFTTQQSFSAGIALTTMTNTWVVYSGVGGVLQSNNAMINDSFGLQAKRVIIVNSGLGVSDTLLNVQHPTAGSLFSIFNGSGTPKMVFNPTGTVTAGDTYYQGTNYLEKLGIGPAGYYMTVSSTGFPQWSPAGLIIFNRRTANYVLVSGDAGKLVEMDVAGANTVTIPANASVAFPVGTTVIVAQYGAGQTTIVAAAGVTLRSSSGSMVIPTRYATATAVKVATNEWYLWNGVAGSGGGGGSFTNSATDGQVTVSDGANIYGSADFTWDNTNKYLSVGGSRWFAKSSAGTLFIGDLAGNFTMTSANVVGIGKNALQDLTTANNVTATGYNAGMDVTTGFGSSYFGSQTGMTITTGSQNNAFGNYALGGPGLMAATENSAFGTYALYLSTGSKHAAFGNYAGMAATGFGHSLLGWHAGDNLTTANQAVVIGYNVKAPSNTTHGQLNIQNIIYGTDNTAENATVSTGKIGIGQQLPDRRLHVADLYNSTNATQFPLKLSAKSQLTTTTNFGVGIEFDSQFGVMGGTQKVLAAIEMDILNSGAGIETSTFKVKTLAGGVLDDTFQSSYLGAAINGDIITGVVLNGTSNANAMREIRMHNASTAASAAAMFRAWSEGSGDAYSQYEVAATQWVVGLDNSDADKFKISRGTALGINDAIAIDPTSLWIGAGISTPAARWHVVGSVRLDIGSDAAGDLFTRSSGGDLQRVAAGTNGHVLTMVAGFPAWAAPTGGGGGSSNPPGGLTNELQKNDGAGAFAGTKVFSTSNGNVQLGDTTMGGGTRLISAQASGTNTVDIHIQPKGTSGLVHLGQNLNDFTVRFDGGIKAHLLSSRDIVIQQGTNKNLYFGGNGNGNYAFNVYDLTSFGGMQGGIYMANSVTIPSANPNNGVYLYVQGGSLKARGAAGSIVTLCPA